MAQLTLYIDDDVQSRLRDAASRRQVSQSQFVAELIRRATATAWPEEVRALAGSLPDFPLAEELRAGQGPDAERVL
jgi:hypothetical protein